MPKGDNIQERLIEFAVQIIKLSSKLNNSKEERHVAGQMLRSGTSPAPNYGEARGAESNRDFVHKLKVVLKELNETWIWLEIIKRCEMLSFQEGNPVAVECDELAKIIASSIRTVKAKNK